MTRTLVYPKTPSSTAHRYNERATYDLGAIHTFMNTTSVLHVSFPPDPSQGPFPATLPMIGQMGSFTHPSADLDEPLDCYLHGYVSSRLMKLARASSSSSSSDDSNSQQGLPLTISATKVDGLVLSLTPFSHSYNYRSAVLFGYAQVVEDDEEKVWAMRLITNSVVPGRWENSRSPPDGAELASTTILRVKVVSGSGKVREGGPGEAGKKDEGLVDRYWTGVVPVWETVGVPVPGKGNRVEEVPEHIRTFREAENERNEKVAGEAARAVYPKAKVK